MNDAPLGHTVRGIDSADDKGVAALRARSELPRHVGAGLTDDHAKYFAHELTRRCASATFAREFLPQEAGVLAFVNADLLAAGLSLDPDRAAVQAGRIMVRAIRNHVARGEDFAFETTLAGRRYAWAIPGWQAAGYRVGVVFIALRSPEIAIARVAARVILGGHSVPEEVIRRRFIAGRESFERVYKGLVDEWRLYDNSGSRPTLIDQGGNV